MNLCFPFKEANQRGIGRSETLEGAARATARAVETSAGATRAEAEEASRAEAEGATRAEAEGATRAEAVGVTMAEAEGVIMAEAEGVIMAQAEAGDSMHTNVAPPEASR
jgi:hypothetical protein